MKSVDWAVKKEKPEESSSVKKPESGKGDAPRHSLRKWDENYGRIKWGKK